MMSNSARKKVFIVFPAISEPTADRIYWIGNVLVLLAALAGMVGAVGVLWGDRVRDYFNDKRISDNELKTATAIQNAADANLRAAEARERTVLLEKDLESEKQKTLSLIGRTEWRHIHDPAKLGAELKAVRENYNWPPLPNGRSFYWEVYSAVDTPEAISYATELFEAVKASGLLASDTKDVWVGVPSGQSPPVEGVIISVSQSSDLEFAKVLQHALANAGVTVVIEKGRLVRPAFIVGHNPVSNRPLQQPPQTTQP
jgi:hypothetical protein